MLPRWAEWAFFYTIVATKIAMAILYLSVSFSSVQRQSAAIRSFIRQKSLSFSLTQANTSSAVTSFRVAFRSMSITPELKYSCLVSRRI